MRQTQLFSGSTHKCPSCGKLFYVGVRPEEWGYAYGSQLTCSYHCMRDMAHRDETIPRNAEKARLAWIAYRCGRSTDEIRRWLGYSTNRVCIDSIRNFEIWHGDYCERWERDMRAASEGTA